MSENLELRKLLSQQMFYKKAYFDELIKDDFDEIKLNSLNKLINEMSSQIREIVLKRK